MSLVADYSDSDNSASDDHDEVSSVEKKSAQELSENDKQSKGASANLLLQGTSDSSDSDSEDNFSSRNRQKKITLDNPFRTFGDVNVAKEDSVFRNPFRDKEDEKIAVLEHHVKMTENPQTSLLINGKKICWNYRKRKCYLGTKCPYAHDSDVPLTEEQLKEQKLEADLHRTNAGNIPSVNASTNAGLGPSKTNTHLPGTESVVAGGYDSSAFFSSPHLGGKKPKQDDSIEDNAQDQPYNKLNKKKRIGLTNSLTPPKKAMFLYHKTKDK